MIRRKFFGQMAGVAAAPLAVAGIKAIAGEPKALMARTRDLDDPKTDMTAALRNWLPNHCPLLARFPWVRVERLDFRMYSGRNRAADDILRRRLLTRNRLPIDSLAKSQDQWCQFFVHPVEMGNRPFDGFVADDRMSNQFVGMAEAAELAMYYGAGTTCPVDGTTPCAAFRTVGLRQAMKTNRLRLPSWEVSGEEFFRRGIARCCAAGGDPDVVLASSDILEHGSRGISFDRVKAGDTVFGTPIWVYENPKFKGIVFLPSPVLNANTAVTLTSDEIWVRMHRNPQWKPRPSRNDPIEGDWKMACAIDVTNEHHHCWAEA